MRNILLRVVCSLQVCLLQLQVGSPKCAVMAWKDIPSTHISVSPDDILWSTCVLFLAINHAIHEPKTFFLICKPVQNQMNL